MEHKPETIIDDETVTEQFGGGGDYRANRPSPSDSATLYEENFIMRGNDKNLWRITVTEAGVHRWVKLRPEEQGRYMEGDYYGEIRQPQKTKAQTEDIYDKIFEYLNEGWIDRTDKATLKWIDIRDTNWFPTKQFVKYAKEGRFEQGSKNPELYQHIQSGGIIFPIVAEKSVCKVPDKDWKLTDEEIPCYSVRDGVHRIAILEDLGIFVVPALVYERSVERITRPFGDSFKNRELFEKWVGISLKSFYQQKPDKAERISQKSSTFASQEKTPERMEAKTQESFADRVNRILKKSFFHYHVGDTISSAVGKPFFYKGNLVSSDNGNTLSIRLEPARKPSLPDWKFIVIRISLNRGWDTIGVFVSYDVMKNGVHSIFELWHGGDQPNGYLLEDMNELDKFISEHKSEIKEKFEKAEAEQTDNTEKKRHISADKGLKKIVEKLYSDIGKNAEKIAYMTSGELEDWFSKNHPEYFKEVKPSELPNELETIQNIARNTLSKKSSFKELVRHKSHGYDYFVSTDKDKIVISPYHQGTGTAGESVTIPIDKISTYKNINEDLKDAILKALFKTDWYFSKTKTPMKKEETTAEAMAESKAPEVVKESITPLPKEVSELMADIPKDALEYNMNCRKIIDHYKSKIPNFPFVDLGEPAGEVIANVPADVKAYLSGYTGMGGLKFKPSMEETKTILYEYYTPDAIISRMWGLAYKHGYKGEGSSVLEPSVATGRFLKYAPDNTRILGVEINWYSYCIAVLLYGYKAQFRYGAFEEMFIKNNVSVKGKIHDVEKFDLVIGNPPYGNFEGKYAGMGEKAYTHARNQVDYFIIRGLDCLNAGGLLVYIIGVETAAGGVPFLDQQNNPAKEMIAERGELIDAYRLPNGVFEKTDVLTDIVVFRKKA